MNSNGKSLHSEACEKNTIRNKRIRSVDEKEEVKCSVSKNAIENKSVVWLNIKADPEDDVLRQKELHLEHLGLITHKAAEKRRQEAALEAATKVSVSSASGSSGSSMQQDSEQTSLTQELSKSTNSNAQQQQQHSTHGKKSGKHNLTSAASQEYTGTLKTVIKLNRSSSNANNLMTTGSTSNGRKSGTNSQINATITKEQQQQNRRQSLKMTFQKGRGRGHGTTNNTERNHSHGKIHDEDNYYTIQNEVIFSFLLKLSS